MRLARLTPLTLTLFLVGCNSGAKETAQQTPTPAPATPPAASAEAPKPQAAKPDAATAEAPKTGAEKAQPQAANAAPPAAPAAPAPPAAPASASDPIVGKWEMRNGTASIVFVMAPDRKVGLDVDATRKGLTSALEAEIKKDPKITAAQKTQAVQEMTKALDQQISAFEGTWTKVGKLYKITNNTAGAEQAKPAWARVEGDKLISTDEKGASKKGDPVANRI